MSLDPSRNLKNDVFATVVAIVLVMPGFLLGGFAADLFLYVGWFLSLISFVPEGIRESAQLTHFYAVAPTIHTTVASFSAVSLTLYIFKTANPQTVARGTSLFWGTLLVLFMFLGLLESYPYAVLAIPHTVGVLLGSLLALPFVARLRPDIAEEETAKS